MPFPRIHKNRFYVEIGKALSHADSMCVDLPLEWRRWGQSEYENPIPFDLKIALIVSAFVDSGYLPEERQEQLDWVSFFHGGKQEYYASVIKTILRRLNEGMTKDEAIQNLPSYAVNYYPSGKIHQWSDLLEYTTFAWRCFYYSWDFTSALHNAAKCPANRRLAMVLTGAFADAMYGCSYNMIKQQFVKGHETGSEWIEIPGRVIQSYGDIINEVRRTEYDRRTFFKKNDALTNCDLAIVVSADSDMIPAIELATEAGHKVVVYFPPHQYSNNLASMASSKPVQLKQYESRFRQCILPDVVHLAVPDFDLHIPPKWKVFQ